MVATGRDGEVRVDRGAGQVDPDDALAARQQQFNRRANPGARASDNIDSWP